ncbi:placenta-expressed transcript 1 protein-like [Pseudophryne corroboree]|uniref:placenta-expressed transcript 1 protein-like n=1 Tax=Pseudophryne corroboree TaxID=495146 RepID=UPI003081F026
MAHTGPAALLLYLALAVSSCYGANISIPTCEIFNSSIVNNNSNSNFNLIVSPDTLSSNTTYSVYLNGSGNFTVSLQAESANTAVGIWSQGSIICNKSLLFVNAFLNGNEIKTNWTSEGNLTTVKINAYIYTDPANETTKFLVSRDLSSAIIPTVNSTTHAPVSGNSTVNTTTATTVTKKTDVTTQQTKMTTSAGYALQSNLISTALIQLLCFVMISKKFLP